MVWRLCTPSAHDLATAQAAFKSVLDEWVAADPRNRVLLKAAESELASLRRSR